MLLLVVMIIIPSFFCADQMVNYEKLLRDTIVVFHVSRSSKADIVRFTGATCDTVFHKGQEERSLRAPETPGVGALRGQASTHCSSSHTDTLSPPPARTRPKSHVPSLAATGPEHRPGSRGSQQSLPARGRRSPGLFLQICLPSSVMNCLLSRITRLKSGRRTALFQEYLDSRSILEVNMLQLQVISAISWLP